MRRQKIPQVRDESAGAVEKEFPGLKESGMHDFAAKADIVTMAFLRDYISVENQLLRELGSLKSQISMAVDHQKKVVKHVMAWGGIG